MIRQHDFYEIKELFSGSKHSKKNNDELWRLFPVHCKSKWGITFNKFFLDFIVKLKKDTGWVEEDIYEQALWDVHEESEERVMYLKEIADLCKNCV